MFDAFALAWPASLLAQAAPAVPSAATVTSVWDLVVKGGPVMIPIGIASLIALAIVVERLVSLRRSKVIPPAFLPGLRPLLEGPKADLPRAMDYCRANGSPVANVFLAGLKRLHEPIELLEKHIEEAGAREVSKLRRNLRTLSVIASISTLLGLLGTITGMIRCFQTVASAGEALGRTELLAKGIYEAMITTAAGLIVAIPVIIAYNYLAARIDALVTDIDQMTCDFVERYAGLRPAGEVPVIARGERVAEHNGAPSAPSVVAPVPVGS
jgi:biopolymer transport protein ExbB